MYWNDSCGSCFLHITSLFLCLSPNQDSSSMRDGLYNYISWNVLPLGLSCWLLQSKGESTVAQQTIAMTVRPLDVDRPNLANMAMQNFDCICSILTAA